jgi:hypothetical protein
MKTVMRSDEVAHHWAHQLQAHARSSNLSYQNESLCSYATEIARIVNRNGKKAYVINDGDYSVTTRKHKNDVFRAIPVGSTIFYAESVSRGRSMNCDGKELYEYSIETAADALALAGRTRKNTKKRERLEARAAIYLGIAQNINLFFGLRRKVDHKAIERLSAVKAKEQKREEERERREQERLEKEKAEQILDWCNNVPGAYFPHGVNRVYLRKCIIPVNGRTPDECFNLETSRHAYVPMADAERAFRFIIARRSKGWHRNGEQFKIGDFQLDAINEQGIIAGCHRIDWQEIERFAKNMGWMS